MVTMDERSQTPNGVADRLLKLRQDWLTIDRNDAAVAFVTTPAGKAAIVVAFVAVLFATQTVSTFAVALIALTVALVAAFPAQRALIIAGVSLAYVVLRPYRNPQWTDLQAGLGGAVTLPGGAMGLQIASVVAFLVFAAAFLQVMRMRPKSFVARRPVITLMTLWGAMFAVTLALDGINANVTASLWIVTGVSISCLWMLAYAAIDLKGRLEMPFAARATLMRPFWGGETVPIGKSWGYLSKFDAKTEEDLAATRLKALKLIVWTFLLAVALKCTEFVLYDWLTMPRLEAAISAHAEGASAGRAMHWASLVSNYFVDLMVIAVWGHGIVATVRMVGFRIPRNTYRPLDARSLAEFWNRYYFYFKEFLVDIFFYPAFLRWFKSNTKLRIAFATLCAAGLGNFLYHFTRESHVFADRSFWDAVAVFHSAMFYSAMLAAGLIISQWRGRKAKPEDGFWRWHVWPRLNVMAFFCFLKIFDDLDGEGTLSDRFVFTGHLFGLG